MAAPTSQQSPTIDIRLNQLEGDLTKLHGLFEQHFAGVLKQRPQRDHDTFKKKMESFSPADFKTTASKFRYQAIKARYVQLHHLWERILTKIEEGTYEHHLFLLKKKEETDASGKRSTLQPVTNAPKQEAQLSEREVTSLYEKIKASSKNPEKLPSKDAFAKNLFAQIERAKEKHPKQSLKIGLKKDESGAVQLVIGLKK